MTTPAPATPDQPAATREAAYDVVVIGGGPVGENAADRAARTGLSVAVVEAELVGGECSYWACMPSKALLRAGAVRALAEDVPGLHGSLAVEPAGVFARRDELTHDWDDASQVEWVEGAGLTLLRGHGRLVGPRLVEVTPTAPGPDAAASVLVHARHAVVLATGSVPVLPDVPGLAQAAPWGSREATSAEQVPDSLVVVGGGVVACEMATAYSDLGSEVTLLARSTALSNAEAFAGEAVVASLRDAGVDVRLGASPTRVSRDPAPLDGSRPGPVTVTFDDPQGGGEVTAAEILVATGRVARTGDVGLETVLPGVDVSHGLPLTDSLQVEGVDGGWLYAAGDVTGRTQTTHQGKYEARAVGDVIAVRYGRGPADGGPDAGAGVPVAATDENKALVDDPAPWTRFVATADHESQPQVVFTRPQVAWVGLTEARARKAGYRVTTVGYDLADVAGASELGLTYAGRVQAVVDDERRVLVGVTLVCPDAGEMLHAATIAVVGEVPLDRLWHAVPSYPTLSEVWLRLLETYGL